MNQAPIGDSDTLEEIEVGPVKALWVDDMQSSGFRPDAGADQHAGAETSMLYQQMYRYAADVNKLLHVQAMTEFDMKLQRHEALLRLARALAMSNAERQASMVSVAVLSALVAHTLQLPEKYCHTLSMAAALRNIGLLGVPAAKPLSGGESAARQDAAIHDHPLIGAAILGGSDSPELQMAEEVALNHHEQYDGTGYPMGRRGRAIPLSARIVFAVEWFDEYLQANQGEPGFSLEQAARALRAQAHRAMDPVVVDAVARCAPLFNKVTAAVTALDQASALDLPQAMKVMWRKFVA
jgi:putative two-component system response regulator